jgi:O-antigen ligase
VAVAASVPILAPVVGPRIEQAASDLRLAFVEENFDSHTGARLAQWPISLRLWRDRPIVGHGLGSYVPEAFARFRPDEPVPEYPRLPGEPRPDRTGPPVLPHPHSAWLHALAMTGLVGAGLCALIWWQVLVNAQRATLRLSPVAPALVPAVLGLFIAFVLDSHHLSAPGTSVLMLVIGLSWPRPTGLAEADSA